ncbi:hypothetical protein BDR04DRAFT_716003 [Suillus decipiens]|nr:hypothetical protein BDR04DRAFT_716003 [Suillus decipiens]
MPYRINLYHRKSSHSSSTSYHLLIPSLRHLTQNLGVKQTVSQLRIVYPAAVDRCQTYHLPSRNVHPVFMANSTNIGNKKALLIAVQSVNKKDFHFLRHAHEDAEALKCLLIDKFNYPEANVVLMKHDMVYPKYLWPSRSNILEQIAKMVANASANDQFFFYYSGHGSQVTCNHHTETDGKDEVIYAYTGHYIVDNRLRKALVEPLPKGCKLFALWDSCHSATILGKC